LPDSRNSAPHPRSLVPRGGVQERTRRRLLIAGVVAALGLLAAVTWLDWRQSQRVQATMVWVARSHEVQARLNRLLVLVEEIETGGRGFVITGAEEFLGPFNDGLDGVAEERGELAELLVDDEQRAGLAALEPLIAERVESVRATVELRRSSGFEAARLRVAAGTGKELMDRIRAEFARLDGRGRALLELRAAAARREGEKARQLTALGMVVSSGLLMMVFALVWRENRLRQRSESALRNALVERDGRAKALEEANRELEAFSYSVSHDLRAPLRSIDGFSQALLEDHGKLLDTEARGYLDRVRAAAQRMGALIDDLLRFSKIGRGDLLLEEVDLSALAAELVADLRSVEPSRKIEVEIEPGLVARADPRLMHVALENLLGNAFKFTRTRADARISFSATRSAEQVVYSVRDNGAGFDMSYADKLFTPFQRLHSPHEFEGTGIGLAIVARVVHRHGGSIRAEAAAGQGATIYFTLAGGTAASGKESRA
jgi:signal transduction histidine kinase